MASKELQAVHEAAEHEKLTSEMAALNVKADAAERAKESERTRKLLESKEIIERQLREKELAKQNEYAAFLKEKSEIDKILKKIENEKRCKAEAEAAKQRETKQFIERYLIEREEHKMADLEREKAESAKIAEWQNVQRERLERLEAAKAAKAESDRIKYEAVKGEIEEKQRAAEEMQDLINELSMEQQQLAVLEKERRLKEEMKRENMRQIRLKQEREAAEKENEMKLRAELLAKYESDERLQRLSQQKRKLKMAQHKKDVEDIIAERQRLKAMA